MSTNYLAIGFGISFAVFLIATITLSVLYFLELQKKSTWQIKISPCLDENNQEITCGNGKEHLIFECPQGKNCGTKPPDLSKNCLNNSTCIWKISKPS
jgi:hypothetical protein